MKIMTVLGEIAPENLGTTLAHEHLIIDVSCRRRMTDDPHLQRIAEEPVSMSILGDLRRNPTISADSLRLNDADLAIKELAYYKELGGRSLMDHTSRWIGGRPLELRRISQAVGVQIVAGCGYYSPALPESLNELSVEELKERLVGEVERGVDGTDVRPGFIGEIGTSWPLTPLEEKTLRAAARAQVETGLGLSIHPSPWDKSAHTLLDIVESEGADLRRVIICHLDHVIDVPYHAAIAKRGAYIEYDRFGVEWYSSQETLRFFPRDTERVVALRTLIEQGFLEHILLSQDVCQKIELREFGGHGYSHILRYVVPMMKKMGVAEEQVQTMMVENPKRFLSH
ncbi:MAG: phosphotriesterase-related protein [Acidimicrobiia bacterium]|nr:phosphotriesterase-related protein [Acidimicrobiia bacterium]